ncbi:MAG: hypothetical protein WA945_00390 [Arcobacteraceae bacterium]
MDKKLELINQIEKNLNKLKKDISNENCKDTFSAYNEITSDTKYLLNVLEIESVESGIENIYTLNFINYIDYILGASKRIDIQFPKDFFKTSSKFETEALIKQKIFLSCLSHGNIEVKYNFIISKEQTNQLKIFEESFDFELKLSNKEELDIIKFRKNVNITYIQGLKILSRIAKYSEDNYLESLKVKCI